MLRATGRVRDRGRKDEGRREGSKDGRMGRRKEGTKVLRTERNKRGKKYGRPG